MGIHCKQGRVKSVLSSQSSDRIKMAFEGRWLLVTGQLIKLVLGSYRMSDLKGRCSLIEMTA